jgi:hypothetical protein
MEHLARLVRDGDSFRLAKPAGLTSETWPTRAVAHRAVRNKLKCLATEVAPRRITSGELVVRYRPVAIDSL